MLAAIACVWLASVDTTVEFAVGFLDTLPGDSLVAVMALSAYDPDAGDFTFAWDKLADRSQPDLRHTAIKAAAHEAIHAVQAHRGTLMTPGEEIIDDPEQLPSQLAAYQAVPIESDADRGAAQFIEAVLDVEMDRPPADQSGLAEQYRALWRNHRTGAPLYAGRDLPPLS
jgi:hypothetical protein